MPLVYVPPTVVVEIAPGHGPRDVPDPGDWVALTIDGRTRLVGFAKERGRDDQTDEFGPGSATLLLDSSDGALDDLRAGSLLDGMDTAWLPIRVRVLDNNQTPTPTSHTVWSGYCSEGFAPVDERGHVVSCPSVDWVGWAASVELPAHAWPTWLATAAVSAGPPVLWWRGTLRTGSTDVTEDVASDSVAIDSGSGGRDAVGLVAGAARPVKSLIDDSVMGMRINAGPAHLAASPSVPSGSTGWVVACVFRLSRLTTTAARIVTARTTTPTGNPRWRLLIDNSGHVVAELFSPGGVSVGSATVALNHVDGEPHIAIASFSTALGWIDVRTDRGTGFDTFAGTAAGAGGTLVLGFDGGNSPIALADVAYFDELLDATPSPQGLADFIDDPDSISIRPDDNLAARVARVLTVGRVPAAVSTPWPTPLGRSRPNPGVTVKTGPMPTSANLAEALQAAGQSIGGGAYCLRDGTVRVRSHGDLYDISGANGVNFGTYVAELTDAPAPPAGLPVVRYSGRGRSARTAERLVNEVRSATAVPGADTTSQLRHGVHSLTIATTTTAAEERAIAADVIAARKDPTYSLDAVEVRPWGDPTATRFVLADLELERPVVFSQHTPGGTAVIDRRRMRVQRESWSWDGGADWSVELQLAGDPDPYAPLLRTNLLTNPSFETGVAGWTAGGSPVPTVTHAASGLSLPANLRTNCALLQWTAPGTVTWRSHNVPTWAAGSRVAFSAWVSGTAGLTATMWIDGDHTALIASVPLTGAGNLVEVRGSLVLPASVSTLYGLIAASGGTGSVGLRVHAALLERGVGPGDYFDGATPADGYVAHAWTGTADASTSTRQPA